MNRNRLCCRHSRQSIITFQGSQLLIIHLRPVCKIGIHTKIAKAPHCDDTTEDNHQLTAFFPFFHFLQNSLFHGAIVVIQRHL